MGDGLAALDALWDAVSVGRPYALVLLDARMPDVDGVTLAGQIRQHWGPRAPRTWPGRQNRPRASLSVGESDGGAAWYGPAPPAFWPH